MFDIAVIGAGVIGGMVARELTKYTKNICILEKGSDVALGATRANSAIVHAGFDAKECSLKARLNVRGSNMMRDVCSELGVKYINNGSLVVGFNEDDEKTLLSLIERGRRNGVYGLRLLNRDEVLALEPNIGDGVTAALHAPTGAIVCPYELCMASIGNAMDNGAELRLNFEVKSIEKCDGGYALKSYKGEDQVIYVPKLYKGEPVLLVLADAINGMPTSGQNEFAYDGTNAPFVKEVVFYGDITVREKAFSGCLNFEKCTFYGNAKIEEGAFRFYKTHNTESISFKFLKEPNLNQNFFDFALGLKPDAIIQILVTEEYYTATCELFSDGVAVGIV